MKKNKKGIFELTLPGDYDGYYYSYLVDGKNEVTDPYCKSSSINSMFSCVVDLRKTDPYGFRNEDLPQNPIDQARIYELSVKDFTANKDSGVENRGKFLGLSEMDTDYEGLRTGLGHLKELGITHIQLMPVFDFISTREESQYFFDDDNYNWGYDPELYFVPEGSYASLPDNPYSRIKDYKKLIQEIHNQGLSVVMDVVFNHTYKTRDSNLEVLYSGYHRKDSSGFYTNGSGVGNELASENPVVRKFIIDNLTYRVEEFKVDGFRFDLMALTDIDTIKLARDKLRKINKNILIYGEPWMGGRSSLPYEKQTLPESQRSENFALFNADFRDAIRGDNDGYQKGYIQGDYSKKRDIEVGLAGSIYYDEGRRGFCDRADETINYFNCHDNLILNDKLLISLDDPQRLDEVSRLAFGLIYLALGKPFIYEGNEFKNSKNNIRNTYNSPLSVNGIDWKDKKDNLDFFKYVKDLIALRKAHPAFSIVEPKEIRERLKFLDFLPDSAVGYSLKEGKKYIVTIINADQNELMVRGGDLKSHFGAKEILLDKIFSKRGKIKLAMRLEDENIVEPCSVNVYKVEVLNEL